MKLLTSKRLTLPKIFFVSNKSELKELPIGIPFIFGDASSESYLIRILEYEVLYQAAIKSGYPFNFKKILIDNGFDDIQDFHYSHPVYMGTITTEYTEYDEDLELLDFSTKKTKTKFQEFVRDSSCYVNIEKLKELNVFPTWLEKIEDAISTNIHNFAVFNNNMYNKKLEGMYGGLELISPNRNLIIIDISGSIPKAVSTTCLTLAKNLAESFYSDLLITGSKSTLYLYEQMHELDINTIYEENGIDNDQTYFKKLISESEKVYETAIVFGDNHSPCQAWSNEFNKKTKRMSIDDGKEICKWKVEKLISFHTESTIYTAGYADWFSPTEVEKIESWVTYLN